jgi:hypothetical protein
MSVTEIATEVMSVTEIATEDQMVVKKYVGLFLQIGLANV